MMNRKVPVMKMMRKVMKHLESKKNSNPYTHTYIHFFFFFFFLVKFFFGVWRSTSLFLSLLMFDWRTVSSSVLWLLDRRYLSLSLSLSFFFFSCVRLHHCCVLFSLSLCLSLIQLWLCMFLFFVYVCRILKRGKVVSICLVNKQQWYTKELCQ